MGKCYLIKGASCRKLVLAVSFLREISGCKSLGLLFKTLLPSCVTDGKGGIIRSWWVGVGGGGTGVCLKCKGVT